MEISSDEVIRIAVAEVISKIGPEQLADALVAKMKEKVGPSYSADNKTYLDSIVQSVTISVINGLVKEMVEAHKEVIRARLHELVDMSVVAVDIKNGFHTEVLLHPKGEPSGQ